MFAVIFKAEIADVDDSYYSMAKQLRELAIQEYGCKDFYSVTEGKREIAISYWDSREAISQWKNNTVHMQAQELGRANWYTSYSVQIVEVLSEY